MNDKERQELKHGSDEHGRQRVPGGVLERELDEHGLSYYDQLVAELRNASQAGVDGAIGPWLESREAGNLTWDDLYRLESAVLGSEQIPQLRRRVAMLRRRFEDLVAADIFLAYVTSVPPLVDKATEEELRADANFLLVEIQRQRIARSAFKKTGEHLARRLLVVMMMILGVLGVLLGVGAYLEKAVTVLPMALLAGMLGETVSALARAREMVPGGSSIEQIEDVSLLRFSRHYGVPIFGAIGALVIYLLFGAQFVSGALFPEFGWQKERPSGEMDFMKFVNDFGPKGGIAYAKTLVWCFIAGFSERLIPDVIDSFVGKDGRRLSQMLSSDKKATREGED